MKFSTLASRNSKEIYRDPVSMILGLGMPAAFLIVFMAIQKNIPADIFTAKMLTPAIIVFSFSFLCIFSAILLSKDRESSFLTRLLASPLSPKDFILSYSLPFLPIALLQTVVGYAIGAAYGVPIGWAMLTSLVVLIPVAVAYIGIGMILGSLLGVNQAPGMGSLVITASSFLGGAWMDLKMVGGTLEKIGYILPFAHAIDAARALINGGSLSDIATDLVWVFAWAIVLFAGGITAFRWQTRRQ